MAAAARRLVPVAMQQGRYAGKNSLPAAYGTNPMPPFHYFDKGSLAVIGRAAAVAEILLASNFTVLSPGRFGYSFTSCI